MAHRLFHSLIFSSAMVLEGLGCTASHAPDDDASGPTDPPLPLDPLDGSADGDGPIDLRADAGSDDAAPPDSGAPDAGDLRICEPGWPTTKASFCATVDMGTEFERIECCNSRPRPDGSPDCCLPPEEA